MKFSYLQLTAIALALVSAAPASENGGGDDNNSPIQENEYYTITDYFPTPQGGRLEGDWGWDIAYHKARDFVSKLSIPEKVNLTSGIGSSGRCVGESGSIESQGFWGICYQDGPLGVRTTDFVTGFPAGISAATTWNKDLIYSRGRAIGSEFKGKGVDVALGPVVGPLGSVALGGRKYVSFIS